MKQITQYSVLLITVVIVSFASCKKETSCENCDSIKNKTPIAVAGPDQVITLPTDSVLLDGSSSSDPDGSISSYIWKKISGPASFSIISPTDSVTKIKALVVGTYMFELKVTDNGGLSAKDTLNIIVDAVLTTNHPPIARAGPDQTITLPTNTIILDGSASTDPENNITSYVWTKISGPSSFNITNANAVQTQVTTPVQGTYQFELKIIDVGGLFSKDTMQVLVNNQLPPPPPPSCDNANRPIRNASFTFSALLPEPRYNITVATVGNKIIVAGGSTSYTAAGSPANFSDRVDIYDISTGQWAIARLPQPRIVDAVEVLGNKIFFAGGWNNNGSVVDIYDVSANTWSTGQSSHARTGAMAGSINNKVLFAGGANIPDLFASVDIYEAATNSWSTASLSEPRYSPQNFAYSAPNPPIIGQKIFFAVGQYCWIQDCPSNRIDIYDAAANTWSYEDYMPHVPGTYLFSGIASGNKNYWVTGDYWQGGNLVEIRDEITHAISYECLSGVLFGHPVKNDNKLIFPVSISSMGTTSYNLTHFDVYDLATNSWSISKLPSPVSYHQLITVNNEIYEMGGYSVNNGFLFDKIYKLNY